MSPTKCYWSGILLAVCIIGGTQGFPIFQSFTNLTRINNTPARRGPIFTEFTPNNNEFESKIMLTNAKEIKAIAQKHWNLDQCPPNIKIVLGKKVLTTKSFYCTKHDAKKLAKFLNGEPLTDRAYVWCRTAFLYNTLSESSKVFDLEGVSKFEQDIVLNRENVDLVLGSYFPTQILREASIGAAHDYQQNHMLKRQKRKVTSIGYHWNNAQVPFSIPESDFNKEDREIIIEAISQYERQTCIRFIEGKKRGSEPHIKFKAGFNGCYSNVGRRLDGQTISLGAGCVYLGTVVHEIGHALGFHHEQSRPDRDEYVEVLEGNIRPNRKEQFLKKVWGSVFTYGIPYDYSSVMHYGTTTFTRNERPTLETKDKQMQMVIGQREELSFLDAKLANINYCLRSCGGTSLAWDKCKHDGYKNPNNCNSCLCPRGLSPPFCDKPLPGEKADCGQQELTATWFKKTLASPGYRNAGFPEYGLCSYLIKASGPGKQVKVQFIDKFFFTDDIDLCYNYVEVRYKKLSLPGPRYCGKSMPKDLFVSHGEELLILIHTDEHFGKWQGFKLAYQEEKCGGCSSNPGKDEPVCLKMLKYNCAPEGQENYCFRQEKYCCSSLIVKGDKCVAVSDSQRTLTKITPTTTTTTTTTTPRPYIRRRILPRRWETTTVTTPQTTTPNWRFTLPPKNEERPMWGPWSAFSACSKTCGLCGRRYRQRNCLRTYCKGSKFDEELCGASVCPFERVEITKTCRKLRYTWCLWYNYSCYETSVCKETTTKPRCCVGSPYQGRCIR